MLDQILIVFAFVLALLAAFGATHPRINFVALALALFFVTLL